MTSIHKLIALTSDRYVFISDLDAPDVAVGVGAVIPDAGIDICFCVKGTIFGVQVGGVLTVVWFKVVV